MNRFYRFTDGVIEKHYKNLKLLCDKHGLTYSRVYYQIKNFNYYIKANITVERIFFGTKTD